MSYKVWKDADGKYHEIAEMDTDYIKNCIKCIERVNPLQYDEECANLDMDNKIFGPKWCFEHARGYLDVLKNELHNREKS